MVTADLPEEDQGAGHHGNFRGTGYVQVLPDTDKRVNLAANQTLWLVLAAELAQQGQARLWHGQAARWMEEDIKSTIQGQVVRRFGAEAAKRLSSWARMIRRELRV